jgi:hypothetical protein
MGEAAKAVQDSGSFDFDRDMARFSPRQLDAVAASDSGRKKFILYGGALGGGKSYLLRWLGVRRLMLLHQKYGIEHAAGMLACEDYPSLKDRQLQKISREFPSWLGNLYASHKDYGSCFMLHEKWGGGALCFRNLDDPSKYASSEWAFIGVDELTKNEYDVFTFLRTRLRWPGLPDIECQFWGGTNPGSIGHGWVKQLWMDKDFPPEWIRPKDYRSTFAYIPSKATDNPYLDEAYWSMLETLPENLRKAFKDGDWDIFIGQAFPEFSRQKHVIPPIMPPDNARIYMTYDWGYGKPFSIGWWFIDHDGRAIRFKEWYGWSGAANQGMRLSDSEVAQGIKDRERKWGIDDKVYLRWTGSDCFAKRPSYSQPGGGQGPSTAEVFSEHGIYLVPGDDSSRKAKIKQFRERLRPDSSDPGGKPMMLVCSNCEHFIRTIPNLVMDSHDVEDVDTDGEDHVYDEACHLAMGRPIGLQEKIVITSPTERLVNFIEGRTDEDPDIPPDISGVNSYLPPELAEMDEDYGY